MRKVRIKGLPKKAHGGNAGGTGQGLKRFMEGKKNYDRGMNQFSEPEFEVNRSISAVDRGEANIEAEGGEVAIVPGQGGIPESYNISGPRHNAGGVPLNLAEDSFIFSDFKDMKIKDPDILAEFGVTIPKKGKVKGKTPAELAKKYDLNKFKKILLDPNSDTTARETAETMIKNYNLKLGKLALIQESMKGFPQGVPAMAMPYLESIGQDPAQFAEQQEGQPMQGEQPMQEGQPPMAAYGGENKEMAKRFPGLDVAQRGGQFTGAFWDSILQEGGSLPSYQIKGEVTEEQARQLATYNYLNENNFTGDTIQVGDDERDLSNKRYKEIMSPITLKGKNFDRPYLEGRSIPTDSIADVPGGIPVHWSKSGKPTPVGPDAKAFNDIYAKYFAKGKDRDVTYKRPEVEQISVTPSPYEQQVGGAILRYQGGGITTNEPNMHELMYGTPADVTMTRDDLITQGQETFPIPESYQGDFYHFNTTANEDEDPYTKTLGDRFRNTTKVFQKDRRNRQTNIYQEGGPKEDGVSEDDYQTAADYNFDQAAAMGPQSDESAYTANPPSVMTQGEIVMTFGTPKEKEAWLLNQTQDAESKGLDANKYIAEELAEMSPEQIARAEQDMKGWPWKSIKKELAKDEAIANRNSHPMKLVDPSTGKIVNETPNTQQIKAFNAATQKTVSKNVKTGKSVYDIPEGATVHDFNDEYKARGTEEGDYVKYPDGSYKKIESNAPVKKVTSASGPENYKPTYGSIEEDVAKAKEIIERNVANGSFEKGEKDTKNEGKWITNRHAKDTLTIAEKDLLTQVSQYRGTKGDLGALDLHFGTQSSKNSEGGNDNFYGFADGELLEYKYWQANNPDGTAEQFDQLDHEALISNRKEFLSTVGGYNKDQIDKLEADGKLTTPGDLYTKEFMTSTKDGQGFTSRLEKGFGKDSGFRDALGDDSKIGMDHVDNFKIDIEQKFSDVGKKDVKDPSVIETADDPEYDQASADAPWWAQDKGNMLMTIGERASINKYMPHSFPVNLAKPDVVYYDPSRALAANAEQSNIAAQTVGSFGNSAQASSQMSGIQGNAFARNANILADYEGKNVGLANQYLDKVKRTQDQENTANSLRMQNLFDQTTMANQQYDNSKRAANRNVFDAWRQGLTNATQTQTMNTLYPQFDTNPTDGGTTSFTKGRPINGSSNSRLNNYTAAQHKKGWEEYQKDQNSKGLTPSYTAYKDFSGFNANNNRSNDRTNYMNQYKRNIRFQ
jgi:hypothetical protein